MESGRWRHAASSSLELAARAETTAFAGPVDVSSRSLGVTRPRRFRLASSGPAQPRVLALARASTAEAHRAPRCARRTPAAGRHAAGGHAVLSGYNYTLRTPEVQRVFETSIKAFAPRNFGHGALHNDIGGWHLQLRACRHFHPEVYDPAWLRELAALQRQLGEDTVAGLREIVAHVTSRPPREDQALARDLGLRLRAVEREILAAWTGLSRRMFAATESLKRRRDTIGHDATPLQDAAPELLHA